MKYYVIIIQRDAENNESKAIYDYANKDDAMIAYHNNASSSRTAGTQGTLAFFLVKLENEFGNTEIMERWTAPEPEPEPEE